MFVAVIIIWVRAALPRMRYDRLIMLTWKSFLPLSFGLISFSYYLMVFLG